VSLDALERRFWRYIGQTPAPPGIDSPCWIWTGARTAGGIPVWWQDGRTRFPHIWAWEAVHGPKPADRQLSPKCMRSACCQPDHRVLRKRGHHLKEQKRRSICGSDDAEQAGLSRSR
jgi:hypothetical protein